MRKITNAWLFTHRNTLFFDQYNEQMLDLQKAISFTPIPSWAESDVQEIIEMMMRDKPSIFIARWQEWSHPITLDEFACLLGQGEWYWKRRNQKPEETTV